MDRSDFFAIVGNKEPIDKLKLGEIYELVNTFPYCQIAHLLLLKCLNDNEDVGFNKQLRHSALHIANREILYYYLNPRPRRAHNNLTDIAIQKVESKGEFLLIDDNVEVMEDTEFYTDSEFSIGETDELLELDNDLFEPDIQEHLTEQPHSVYNVDKNELRKQQQSELIDKFIVTNPRIEQTRDKSIYNVADLAAPYLEETGGLVTETLARIYINQEYYSKAISIYEKLILKYPEKSSYFAAQIEKIEEHIKK